MRHLLTKSRRIVLKVGTSILTSPKGLISVKKLEAVSRQVTALHQKGFETALVSSGSIAFGMQTSGLKRRPKKMSTLQACAAIGQGKLMHAYEKCFRRKKITTAQLLLTRDGLERRDRFLNTRHTFDELFRMKVLPVINENDTVSTEEIAFGDNDILSVQVAHLIHADLLIFLSDTDGFYLKDGSRIREVVAESEIDRELIKHLKDTRKEKTVGGMRAKLEAARTSMKLGVPLLMINGHEEDGVAKALKGEDIGTLFGTQGPKKNARKKWIAYSAARRGSISVDHGAFDALTQKKRSLLPSGLKKVQGPFGRGDVVELKDAKGIVFGRGVTRYGARELEKIAGKKTSEIESILGYQGQAEIIHRNDLVLWS